MKGRNKHIILAVLALALAFTTSFVAYRWLQARAVGDPETDVVVAARDLQWGTVVNADMLKVNRYRLDSAPEGYFSKVSKLEGRVVTAPINSNEPVLEYRLAPRDIKSGGVAAVIRPGKRAMAVKVDRDKDISGFIHPGNRVDVLVSISQYENRGVPITKTVLENIPVLAVGSDTNDRAGYEKPFPVEIITLEVTPEQAEKLALASAQGKLQLSLRNYIDNESVSTRGSTIPALLGGQEEENHVEKRPVKRRHPSRVVVQEVAPAPVPAPVPDPAPVPEKKPDTNTISLIKGDKVDKMQFKGGEQK